MFIAKYLCVAISLAVWTQTGLPAGGFAQADPPDPESVAKLIAQLGAKDFRAREHATKALERLGASVLPALRKAAKGNLGLEAKRRIEQMITRIETAHLKEEEKHWQELDEPRRGISVRLVQVLSKTPALSDQ